MAQRQIFIVNAQIVDANGAFHVMDGYPQIFDSKLYNNDIDKAKKRAESAASEQWSLFCKRDDRQLQVVTIYTVDGFEVKTYIDGKLADVVNPEPEPVAE